MNSFQGYGLITPADLHWRPSNLMKIPNADFLERTGSEKHREGVNALKEKRKPEFRKHAK